MLTKIISGGQSGADQAALRAAHLCGIATGGWAPKGWLTEDRAGRYHIPNPNLRDFGLIECPEPNCEPFEPRWQWVAACYKARTARNARESDMTFWFDLGGEEDSRGYLATRKAATNFMAIRRSPHSLPPDQFAEAWGPSMHGTINIAGNRESKAPGIGAWVERYLVEVFTLLGFAPVDAVGV